MTIRNDVNWNSGPALDGDKWGEGTVCPVCLQVKDWLGRCDCNAVAPDLVGIQRDGFNLELFLWEDPALVVAEAEAILEEKDAKPGLGVELWWPEDQTDEGQGSTDDDPEPTETEEGGGDDGRSNDELDASLDFTSFLADCRRHGPRFRLTAAQVDEIEREPVGAELCEAPYRW